MEIEYGWSTIRGLRQLYQPLNSVHVFGHTLANTFIIAFVISKVRPVDRRTEFGLFQRCCLLRSGRTDEQRAELSSALAFLLRFPSTNPSRRRTRVSSGTKLRLAN